MKKSSLTVPEQHQRRVARDTMRMHCTGARIMGGMTHHIAARLLGVSIPVDCTCARDDGRQATGSET
jgi:hypothetical protein